MKVNKKLMMRTKIIVGFVILDVLVLFLLWAGYSTAEQIVTRFVPDDPNAVKYLMSYNIFSGIILGAFLIIAGGISVAIPRQLRRSSKNLIDITREIAKGNMDVEIKKIYDDEFGSVIDEYVIMAENIRNQAIAARAVAEGDMTVKVIPSSDVDTMGNALATLVERNAHTRVRRRVTSRRSTDRRLVYGNHLIEILYALHFVEVPSNLPRAVQAVGKLGIDYFVHQTRFSAARNTRHRRD